MTTPEQHSDESEAPTSQPDPSSSSDGDGSWTDDPITQDPDEDRSVEHVIEQTRDYGDGDATDEG
jgi:hypothetical protein